MDVNDPSKIQAFQDCPRGFFFRYVLGWEKEQPNIHLVFGSAWHEAMEHLYKTELTNEEAVRAYEHFERIFKEGFPNEFEWDSKAPKNPEYAFKSLAQYVLEYKGQDNYETLFTEVAGTVPVREDRIIHTKVDAIVRDEDGIWSHEHKTSGRNSAPWREKWHIILQVGAYSHLVKALFPDELVQGVKINGAVFTKSRTVDFLRIPVRKTSQHMQEFLWEVNHWLDQMEWNFRELEKCSQDDAVMMAFPRNAQSCSKFGCRYPGLCPAWQNPLKHCGEPPPGLRREFWDPRRENEEDSNYVAKPDEEGKVKIEKHKQGEEDE